MSHGQEEKMRSWCLLGSICINDNNDIAARKTQTLSNFLSKG